MKKIEINIENCTNCPYHYNYYDDSYCERTLEEFDDGFYDKIDNKVIKFPLFCPLEEVEE